MPGFVLWFTGLSGSGKSTLATLVSAELRRRGAHVEILDGDEVRKNLSKGLGFSKEDRDANVRRVGFVARLVARSGACAVTAAISPYRAVRDEVRASVECFCEVFCDCPISVLAARDPKGLYERALRGAIKNFTGVDDPYEAPPAPEVHLRTDQEAPEQSARKIIARLEELGFVGWAPRSQGAGLAPPYGGEVVEVPFPDVTAPLDGSDQPLVLDAEGELAAVAVALGLVAPLRGFMGSRDALTVARARHLERGLPWPEPLVLRGAANVDSNVRLVTARGEALGVLRVAEQWQGPVGTPCLGGELRLERLPAWAKACHSARAFRREHADTTSVVGLPLFGAPTLADEHWARHVLEGGGRLALLPLVGPDTKDHALSACEVLVQRYLEPSRVTVAPLPQPYGSTRVRAELLAIYAQNLGIARLLVPATWLAQHANADRSLFASQSLTTSVDALPELRFDERVGGLVSERSRISGGSFPGGGALALELRPEVAALGRLPT